MTLYVAFDDYGASPEGPIFRGVFSTREAARAELKEHCYGGRWLPADAPPHDCDNRSHGGTCENTWWFIQEVELDEPHGRNQ